MIERPIAASALLAILVFAGIPAHPQTGNQTDRKTGVVITIAPAEGAVQTSAGLKLKVTIANTTNRNLVRRYALQRDPVEAEVRNTDGRRSHRIRTLAASVRYPINAAQAPDSSDGFP